MTQTTLEQPDVFLHDRDEAGPGEREAFLAARPGLHALTLEIVALVQSVASTLSLPGDNEVTFDISLFPEDDGDTLGGTAPLELEIDVPRNEDVHDAVNEHYDRYARWAEGKYPELVAAKEQAQALVKERGFEKDLLVVLYW